MSILQDLINIVLMPARSVCDDNAITYYVHASPMHFQHMGIMLTFHFVQYSTRSLFKIPA
jgi:hypothetical protein